MGECNYYLKARFETAKQAKAAVPRLTSLLVEGEKAYAYWQAERTREAPSSRNFPTAKTFWVAERDQFPLVCQYLADLNGTSDWNNGLAGQLGMLIDPRREPNASLVCESDLIYLRLNDVWHGSELRLLEQFCMTALGASAVGSASAYPDEVEEEPDEPFDFIDV